MPPLTDISTLHPVPELELAHTTSLSVVGTHDPGFSSARNEANLRVEVVTSAVSFSVVNIRT